MFGGDPAGMPIPGHFPASLTIVERGILADLSAFFMLSPTDSAK